MFISFSPMTTSFSLRAAEQDAHIERRSDHRFTVLSRGSRLYVTAWLVGLALKPAGVTSADTAGVIVRNYVEHRAASLAQVLLVHAVAAGAALAFSIGLARLAESSHRPTAARWGRGAGLAVCLVSLVQAAIGVVMITTAGAAAPSTTRQLLVAVERLDAVKLIALAVLCGVGVVLAHAGLLARWTGGLAAGAIGCLLVRGDRAEWGGVDVRCSGRPCVGPAADLGRWRAVRHPPDRSVITWPEQD